MNLDANIERSQGQSVRRRTDRRDQQPCIAFDLDLAFGVDLVFAFDLDLDLFLTLTLTLILLLARSANPPDPLSYLTSQVFPEQSIIL